MCFQLPPSYDNRLSARDGNIEKYTRETLGDLGKCAVYLDDGTANSARLGGYIMDL